MASIPETMRSLVAFGYCEPAEYQVVDIPVPEIRDADDILIKVHAMSFTPSELQILAGGAGRLIVKLSFPVKLGSQGSGVIVAVGSQVKTLRVGDAVYGVHMTRPHIPPKPPGYCSEYVVTKERLVLPKPSHLSFEGAAALPGDAVTAVQCMKKGLELMGSPNGTLEGKTVFVPAALSGTGSVGCQLIKHAYGAQRLISTVSTAKVSLVDQCMPNTVDEVIDYTKQDPVRVLGKGKVDLVYNTQWQFASTFPLLKPNTGVAVSIASIPPSDVLRPVIGKHNMPLWLSWACDLAQFWYKFLLRGTQVRTAFVSGNPEIREDLEVAGEMIAMGKVRPVIQVVELDDLAAVRKCCQQVRTGKGGLGKMVIKIA